MLRWITGFWLVFAALNGGGDRRLCLPWTVRSQDDRTVQDRRTIPDVACAGAGRSRCTGASGGGCGAPAAGRRGVDVPGRYRPVLRIALPAGDTGAESAGRCRPRRRDFL